MGHRCRGPDSLQLRTEEVAQLGSRGPLMASGGGYGSPVRVCRDGVRLLQEPALTGAVDQVVALGRARTCMRSPCRPNSVRNSAGSGPGLPNQCGVRVSNSAASPVARIRSCGPRTSRTRLVRRNVQVARASLCV